MFNVVVLYGQPDNADAFDRYYEQTHIPIAQKIPGFRRAEVTKIVATPDGSTSPYHQVTILSFDSPEDAQAGLQSSEGQAAVQDIANFATGGATVLLGPSQSLS